jgi:pyrroline-5-carboxylate reductase
MTQQSLALFGGGNMATAMIRGLAIAPASPSSYSLSPQQIVVCEKDAQKCQTLRQTFGVHTCPDIEASVVDCTVWLLAVKPQDIPALGENLAPWWQEKAQLGISPLVISIAAGISIESLSQWFGGTNGAAPAGRIVRVMPNTAAAVGRAISGAFASRACTSADRALTTAILSAIGQVVWVENEALMHAITAISGSGTAYYFYFTECLAQAAKNLGIDDKTAALLARETLIGAGLLADSSLQSLTTLREQVTSKGGTTAKALEVLAKQLPTVMVQAANAAQQRSVAMGQPPSDNSSQPS